MQKEQHQGKEASQKLHEELALIPLVLVVITLAIIATELPRHLIKKSIAYKLEDIR